MLIHVPSTPNPTRPPPRKPPSLQKTPPLHSFQSNSNHKPPTSRPQNNKINRSLLLSSLQTHHPPTDCNGFGLRQCYGTLPPSPQPAPHTSLLNPILTHLLTNHQTQTLTTPFLALSPKTVTTLIVDWIGSARTLQSPPTSCTSLPSSPKCNPAHLPSTSQNQTLTSRVFSPTPSRTHGLS